MFIVAENTGSVNIKFCGGEYWDMYYLLGDGKN